MSPSRAHGERGDRPRVLVLTSTFPRWKGDSTPRFVLDLAMLAARRAHVTVLAPGAPGALSRETWGGIDVRRFAYFVPRRLQRLCYEGGMLPNLRASWLARVQAPLFALAEAAHLRNLVAEHDLVHAHWMLPQGLVVAAASSANVPIVLSIHGSDLFALRGPLFSAAQRLALSRANVITVNSEVAGAELLARHRASVGAKLERLPMGFDESVFSSSSATTRDPELVACVGRLGVQKGVDVVLEAMQRVRAKRPRARLVIAGEGPLARQLAARARALFGSAPAATFAGGLEQGEVAALLRRASVFVAASREGEGQGLSVIEAMACECPVVVSESGALGTLAEGDRALMVPCDDRDRLADAIVTVLSDRDAAHARAARASEYVRSRYTWSAIEPRLFACYARVHPAGAHAWA